MLLNSVRVGVLKGFKDTVFSSVFQAKNPRGNPTCNTK